MTAAVRAELCQVAVAESSARRAEVATLLRFAGGVRVLEGRVVVEAEVAPGAVVARV